VKSIDAQPSNTSAMMATVAVRGVTLIAHSPSAPCAYWGASRRGGTRAARRPRIGRLGRDQSL